MNIRTRYLYALLGAVALTACAGSDATSPQLSVAGVKVSLTGCGRSASPLPGWTDCTGTITVDATGTPSSGYFSVYMNYGSTGSFYHGAIAAASAGRNSYVISVVNDYIPQCFTSVTTSVEVYDGPPSASNAPLITSIPLTLTGTC